MSACLLTMNPASLSSYDSDTIAFLEEQAQRFRDGEPLKDSYWSTRTASHQAGERAYLLRQGDEPRGIFASGRLVTGEIELLGSFRDPKDVPSDAKDIPYVFVEWDVVLDRDEPLPLDVLLAAAPSTHWSPMGSGTRIKPADERAVEEAWKQFLNTSGGTPRGGKGGTTTDPSGWDPSYTEALRKVRKHQAKFRRLLLKHFTPECAYCGLDVVEVLEAAHLIPDSQGGAASTENGRLLCANHHRAFDAGLLRWTGGQFEQVEGAATVLPTPQQYIP